MHKSLLIDCRWWEVLCVAAVAASLSGWPFSGGAHLSLSISLSSACRKQTKILHEKNEQKNDRRKNAGKYITTIFIRVFFPRWQTPGSSNVFAWSVANGASISIFNAKIAHLTHIECSDTQCLKKCHNKRKLVFLCIVCLFFSGIMAISFRLPEVPIGIRQFSVVTSNGNYDEKENKAIDKFEAFSETQRFLSGFFVCEVKWSDLTTTRLCHWLCEITSKCNFPTKYAKCTKNEKSVMMIININGSSGHQSDRPLHKVFAAYFSRSQSVPCVYSEVGACFSSHSTWSHQQTTTNTFCESLPSVHRIACNTFTSTMANGQFVQV